MPQRSGFWSAVWLGLLASLTAAEETPLQTLQRTLQTDGPVYDAATPKLQVEPLFGSPFRESQGPSPQSNATKATSREAHYPSATTTPELALNVTPEANCARPDACCSSTVHDCGMEIQAEGWISAGYHSKSNNLFNDRPDDVAVHQGWLSLQGQSTGATPLGFRIDAVYGLDADNTQSFGNPAGSWDYLNGFDHGSYGWAIPQAFVETAIGDWQVKVGHFFTLAGYEVVTSPDNFFYSHAMTMNNSEPFTHTGVLASKSVGNVEWYAGWTLGWDTGFDQVDGGNAWLGGARLGLGTDASLSWISSAGNLGRRGDEAYLYSLVFESNLTNRLQWILQSDVLRVRETGEDNIGVNQYFLYCLCDCASVGARLEWWKGDVVTGYAPHGAVLPTAGSLSYYAATVGLNLRPRQDVVVRPEIRSDWSPAGGYSETYFGVDAIYSF